MYLIYRPACRADLPVCLSYTRDLFAFDADQQARLLEMWQAMLRDGNVNFWVMEDLTSACQERIVYFCVTAFFSESFAVALQTGLPPCMTTQALEWWTEGRAPFLTRSGIRQANAEGRLSMACFQSGFQGDLVSQEAGREVREKLGEIITLTGCGYNVQDCFFEAYGRRQREWAMRAGFHVCHDYAADYAMRAASCPADEQACLLHLSRAEALANEGTLLAAVFHVRSPRFGFREPEQELLLWALSGMTDEELAAALGLALITIRKRWARIYDHVQEAAPELFPTQAHAEESRRGPEKRRRLLHYVRCHLEELRPW